MEEVMWMCDGYAAIQSKKKRRLKSKPLPRWHWTLLRLMLLILAISTSIYITIPDYPWGTPLFMALTVDPTGWLHEIFYVWTFCLVGIDLTYHFEKKSSHP